MVRVHLRPPADAVIGPNEEETLPGTPKPIVGTTSSKNTPHAPWQEAVPSPTRATRMLLDWKRSTLGVGEEDTVADGEGVELTDAELEGVLDEEPDWLAPADGVVETDAV